MNRIKGTTLRLDTEMYVRAKEIARKQGESFSKFIRNLIEERIKRDEHEKLFEAFSLLSTDNEETDVEFARDVQKEVVLKNE